MLIFLINLINDKPDKRILFPFSGMHYFPFLFLSDFQAFTKMVLLPACLKKRKLKPLIFLPVHGFLLVKLF